MKYLIILLILEIGVLVSEKPLSPRYQQGRIRLPFLNGNLFHKNHFNLNIQKMYINHYGDGGWELTPHPTRQTTKDNTVSVTEGFTMQTDLVTPSLTPSITASTTTEQGLYQCDCDLDIIEKYAKQNSQENKAESGNPVFYSPWKKYTIYNEVVDTVTVLTYCGKPERNYTSLLNIDNFCELLIVKAYLKHLGYPYNHNFYTTGKKLVESGWTMTGTNKLIPDCWWQENVNDFNGNCVQLFYPDDETRLRLSYLKEEYYLDDSGCNDDFKRHVICQATVY